MPRGFCNILVPVLPFGNAEEALRRATEWLHHPQATIVVLSGLSKLQKLKAIIFSPRKTREQKTPNWVADVRQPGIAISYQVVEGQTSAEALISKAGNHQADLIVLPAQRKLLAFTHSSFPVQVATATGVPVLQLKRKTRGTTSVVVPAQNGVSLEMLEKISTINKKTPVHVHLVAFNLPAKEFDNTAAPLGAMQAYQWLKSNVKCPVEFSSIRADDETTAVNNYVHHLNTDVLLLR